MAKEIIMGGVPREDLDDDGNFLPGREEYNRLYNASWGGYRGEEKAAPTDAELVGQVMADFFDDPVQEPARRRRNAPAPEPEVAPEVVVEPEPEPEAVAEPEPEPVAEAAPEQAPEQPQE